MNIDLVANIAQIVESFVLIASLFYLSLQIKQSNKITKSQTRRTLLKMDIDDIAIGRENPNIIRLWTKEELTPEEKISFAHHLLITMRQREYEWQELQNEAVDPSVFDTYAKILNVHLGTPRSRSWWQEFKEMYNAGFVNFVDSKIKDQPLTQYFQKYEAY